MPTFDNTPRRLARLAVALLLAAMLTTVAVLFESPEPIPRVGLTALGLIAVTGVLQPARSVALILAILSAAGQVALGLGNGLPLAPATLLGGAGTVLVGILADELGKAHRQERRARDEMLRAVDALRSVDGITGVTKWIHARLAFEREVARARRYERPLTLLRVAIDQWDIVQTRLGRSRSAEVLTEVGAHLVRAGRVADIPAYHGDGIFSLLLPDTAEARAQIVARRVVDFPSSQAGVRLRVGVAPLTSALTDLDQLLEQAEMALAISARLGLPHAACRDDDPATRQLAEAQASVS